MKLLMYLILGIIQGFTEPIPVSSSGHLVIFNSILNGAPQLIQFLFDMTSPFLH